MWWGIWSVATTINGFWTWIWPTRHWIETGSCFLVSMLEKLNLLCLISVSKTTSKNIGAFIGSVNFFLLWLLCISINQSYGLAWNIVVISGQVVVAAIWKCYISYQNWYVGRLVLHLLPLLNPWLIVKMWPVYVFYVGITLVDIHVNWLTWLNFLILNGGLLVILMDCMIFLSPFLDCIKMSIWTVVFLTQLDLNYLTIECFPLAMI